MNIVQANKKWPAIVSAVEKIGGISIVDPSRAFEQFRESGVHCKLEMVCSRDNTHGTWSARVTSLKEGHGCPSCGKHKSGVTRSSSTKTTRTLADELRDRVGGTIRIITSEGIDIPALSVTDSLTVVVADVDKFGQNQVPKKTVQTLIRENPGTVWFWSDEWRANSELIATKIKHMAKQSELESIYARKCEIRELTNRQAADLLNRNHIQGSVIAQIVYGLFYGDRLVAVQTFSSPRILMSQNKGKDTTGEYELVRYATDTGVRVIGGASKMMKHFVTQHKPTLIFSMSDNRWSVGNMYQQLGFEPTRVNGIEYYYVVDGIRKHRWGFRKDILKLKVPDYDPVRTEYDTVFNVMGHDRVWGAGTTKWVYDVAANYTKPVK